MPPKSSSSSHEAPSQGTFFLYRMQGSFPTLLSTHPQNKIHWSTWEEVFINKSDITYLISLFILTDENAVLKNHFELI